MKVQMQAKYIIRRAMDADEFELLTLQKYYRVKRFKTEQECQKHIDRLQKAERTRLDKLEARWKIEDEQSTMVGAVVER